MRPVRWGRAVQVASVATISARLARALGARPPVARSTRPGPSITVVVPARDEADRIAPLLTALRGAPRVRSVIVVDDGSSDGTARVAAAAGATVLAGLSPPIGWTGKTWALEQGVRVADTEWIVTFDADVVPDPDLPRSAVDRAIADRLDLLTLAGRFELTGVAARSLHAAMLAQLVLRFGPPGGSRRLANGQCIVARRSILLGGLRAVSGDLVEDVALARHLASVGRVDFLDATDLMTVRPYGSAREVWTGWGRSIGLRGIEPRWRQLLELVVVASAVVAPPIGLVRRRVAPVDVVAIALRVGTLVGMRRAYVGRGVGYWCSPLADPIALAATFTGLTVRSPTWRGRRVATRRRRSRTAAPRRSSARP
jgi:dolichol-phosphate mannosyltransferase